MLRLLVLLLAFLPIASAHSEPVDASDVITKSALYIFDGDFVNVGPDQLFSEDELAFLRNQKENLTSMAAQALGRQDSASAADFIGYFKLYGAIPALRHRFLVPGTTYGWEGPDYTDESNYLTDNQYVYHSRYFDALRALFGSDVAENLNLSDDEKDRIIQLSQLRESRHYYWARWMRRKLGF